WCATERSSRAGRSSGGGRRTRRGRGSGRGSRRGGSMTCDLDRRERGHRERAGFLSLVVPMKTFARYLVLCALPVLFGAGSGYYFTTVQGSCGAMVGALFSG